MTSTTKRFAIVAALLIATLVALGVFIQQLRSQSVALMEALQTLENQAAVQRAFASLSEILEASVAEREEIESYVIDGEQGTIAFLTTIETLATQYGVTLSSTQLEPRMGTVFQVPIITVSTSFTGPRQGAETFLVALENLPYASYASDLTIANTASETGGEALRGTVTIHAAVRNIEL